MRWIASVTIMLLAAISILLSTLLIKFYELDVNKNDELNNTHAAQLNDQNNNLNCNRLLEDIYASVSHLKTDVNKVREDLALQKNTIGHRNQLIQAQRSSENRPMLDELSQEKIANTSRLVDSFISAGTLTQEDIHNFKANIATLPNEAAVEQLRRVVQALNRGEIHLPPGVNL
ncbi:hypothetical protein [Pleionea sediminis]|uniref:hypothetical protein n=1 Tax=Pleionea sediminis TaxID=2569479 RepID=UPI001185576B|nr:hypothetical protein [Pleionea sediminis]